MNKITYYIIGKYRKIQTKHYEQTDKPKFYIKSLQYFILHKQKARLKRAFCVLYFLL